MVYKLTITIKNLKEEDIQKITALLKDYDEAIEQLVIEKKDAEE